MVTINLGPCDCCGECNCNCTLELTAFANGSCGGGSSFKVYLKVDDEPVEVARPEAYPIIEKSFTDGPHEICMWWNESDLDSNDGETRNIPFFWFGNLALAIDAEDTAEAQVCLSSCNIPNGSTMTSVQITLYIHQNESGAEEGVIHLTELRLWAMVYGNQTT